MVKAFFSASIILSLLFCIETKAQDQAVPLTETECETSVTNIQKSIKKHKLNLRKQKARSLSNIEKNIIRTMLADLSSKVSVDACVQSEGKIQQGYLCMLEQTDIKECRMDKPEATAQDSE